MCEYIPKTFPATAHSSPSILMYVRRKSACLLSHEAEPSRTPRASLDVVWSARCCNSQSFLTIVLSVYTRVRSGYAEYAPPRYNCPALPRRSGAPFGDHCSCRANLAVCAAGEAIHTRLLAYNEPESRRLCSRIL